MAMKTFHGFAELTYIPQNCIVTIGNFDGVHLGHQQIFAEVCAEAKRNNGISVVITFKPHPQIALRPETNFKLLNTYAEKLEILEELGIDLVVEEPFSREFSNRSADIFVREDLMERLDLRALYLGYDFAFGSGRMGSVKFIQEIMRSKNIPVHEVSACFHEKEVVSSSRIRNCLDLGDIATANKLLGRNFFVRGLVAKGVGRGKKIGIPTANLAIENRKIPKLGVYATEVIWQGQRFRSISNVGVSPTFQSNGEEAKQAVIESHIFNFDQNIYGHSIQVEFLEFIREEKKFANVDELVQQIKKDMARVQK